MVAADMPKRINSVLHGRNDSNIGVNKRLPQKEAHSLHSKKPSSSANHTAGGHTKPESKGTFARTSTEMQTNFDSMIARY